MPDSTPPHSTPPKRPPQRPPLFGYHLMALSRRWRRAVDGALALSGLTDASWTLLIHLDEGGDGISQAALAARVGLKGPGTVRLLDLLEKRGLVERRTDRHDRRAHRILLTLSGRAEIGRIRGRLAEVECGLLADLGEQDITRMLDAFARIEARLQEAR